MKKLHWIVMAVLTAMFVTVGCSNSEEPKQALNREYNGAYVKDGKLYGYLYAPEGMKYAPVSAEKLPQCIKNLFKSKYELERAIVFEGEYEGHHAYWMHCLYSSSMAPHIVHIEGSLPDNVDSFRELSSELTCIYIGEHYVFCDVVDE
ncbi:MAG: hypothetical protein K2K98_06705 [Muribaculaceae bacterium]|nr:hypothetical protein [Muribaculaceae bacterium]